MGQGLMGAWQQAQEQARADAAMQRQIKLKEAEHQIKIRGQDIQAAGHGMRLQGTREQIASREGQGAANRTSREQQAQELRAYEAAADLVTVDPSKAAELFERLLDPKTRGAAAAEVGKARAAKDENAKALAWRKAKTAQTRAERPGRTPSDPSQKAVEWQVRAQIDALNTDPKLFGGGNLRRSEWGQENRSAIVAVLKAALAAGGSDPATILYPRDELEVLATSLSKHSGVPNVTKNQVLNELGLLGGAAFSWPDEAAAGK
jgi:hypothetical protein